MAKSATKSADKKSAKSTPSKKAAPSPAKAAAAPKPISSTEILKKAKEQVRTSYVRTRLVVEYSTVGQEEGQEGGEQQRGVVRV